MTRNSERLLVITNLARPARLGWLETPFDFGCNLWAAKPPKRVIVDNC